MLQALITTYPWDLLDEDLDAALDRLHGEVGVTGVSVWAASPPVVQLRARNVEPRVFRTRGGLFFHPVEERYSGTRLKPIVSGWVKSKHPLKRIVEACGERGMELRAIVSAAMTGRLAERHPEMACKNLFTDVSHTSICLLNPDVQTYLCSLVSDLSTDSGLSAVTITDFVSAWGEAFGADLRVGVKLGETDRSLLSTCFCESCHQRATAADVDVAMAQRSAQVILNKCLDNGTPTGAALDTLLADNEPLAAYYRVRGEEMSSFLGRLVEACQGELLLDRCLRGQERTLCTALDWSLPSAVITHVDRPEELAGAFCGSARRNELGAPGRFAHRSELVSVLSQAVELGFTGVNIDNYGLLPDTALTPVKQAIRLARRTTSE